MSGDGDVKAWHVEVEGRVQGVGFRYSTRQRARRLGLVGYVRNRSDGSVEVVCEGPAAKADRLVAWLAEGPPGARVSDVRKRQIKPSGSFDTFSVGF